MTQDAKKLITEVADSPALQAAFRKHQGVDEKVGETELLSLADYIDDYSYKPDITDRLRSDLLSFAEVPRPIQPKIETGIYSHFKGGRYEVIGVAKHSEGEDDLVVYRNLKDGNLWVRPVAMWLEEVLWPDGQKRQRFFYASAKK